MHICSIGCGFAGVRGARARIGSFDECGIDNSQPQHPRRAGWLGDGCADRHRAAWRWAGADRPARTPQEDVIELF